MALSQVGCVKRSETHHRHFSLVRYAPLHAPYEDCVNEVRLIRVQKSLDDGDRTMLQ